MDLQPSYCGDVRTFESRWRMWLIHIAGLDYECADIKTDREIELLFLEQQLSLTIPCGDVNTLESYWRLWLLSKLSIDNECSEQRTNNELWMDWVISQLATDYQCGDPRTFKDLMIEYFDTHIS